MAAIIIPLYLTMRDFHLLNTYGSVIVADIALAAPIFVFIMRAFFKDLPGELDDAARVDGANEFQIFWQIMLPLARPGLMTVALLEFLWSWNDLLLPLVFLVTDDLRTLPVGMLFFQGRFTIDYGLMSAGVLIISCRSRFSSCLPADFVKVWPREPSKDRNPHPNPSLPLALSRWETGNCRSRRHGPYAIQPTHRPSHLGGGRGAHPGPRSRRGPGPGASQRCLRFRASSLG